MSSVDTEAFGQLLRLKLDFVHRLHDGLTDILDAWERLLIDPCSQELRATLEIKAHSLAGNAGIFGLSQLSDAASRLETAVATRWPAPDDCALEMEQLGSAVARTLAQVGEPDEGGRRRQLA